MMSMINKAKTSGQMKTIDEILNRQKYGLSPKSPDSQPSPHSIPQEPPEWMDKADQQHHETQEWFHQKLAETGEEFVLSSPEESSTIWSPSDPNRQFRTDPDTGEKLYNAAQTTPMYTNSESFFSKNDPTHSLSYVSDQDKDGSGSTEQENCNST